MSKPLHCIPWMTPWNAPYVVYVQNHGLETVKISSTIVNTILNSNQGIDSEVYVKIPLVDKGTIVDSIVSDRISISCIQPDSISGLYVYHDSMEKFIERCVKRKIGIAKENLVATVLWEVLNYATDHPAVAAKRFIITTKYTWAGFNYGNMLPYDSKLFGDM